MIRFADRVRNDVVYVEQLALSAQCRLGDPAALTLEAVAHPRACRLLFPVLPAPIVFGCTALPRRVATPSDVCSLPRRVTLLGAKQRAVRSEGLKAVAAMATRWVDGAALTPARLGAIFGVCAMPMDGKRSVTNRALLFELRQKGRADLPAPSVTACAGAKATLGMVSLKALCADLARFYHTHSLAQAPLFAEVSP